MAFSFSEISTLLVFTSVTHTSSSTVRGCGEGWANHFSVQTTKGINEFVGGSHIAELRQHQKVIDY